MGISSTADNTNMSQRRNDERQWRDDLVQRQRNIVFPDTVENEGRFWRGILRGEIRLNTFQKIGTAIVVLLAVGMWGHALLTMVTEPGDNRPLWARVLSVGVPLALAVVMLLMFMALIGWQTRREQRRNRPAAMTGVTSRLHSFTEIVTFRARYGRYWA